MNTRGGTSILRWFSFLLILSAVGLFTIQVVRYSRLRANFPAGFQIGGVPVGGTNRQVAAERLLEVYSTPVALFYGEASLHLSPEVVGFELDLESMLAAADLERTQQSFWHGFWGYLSDQTIQPEAIPLAADFEETRLRTYLQDEIVSRYDQPPIPAKPIVGTVKFEPGQSGTTLDLATAVTLIERALFSPTRRSVSLPIRRQLPRRPVIGNLAILLQQTISLAGLDSLVGLFLVDLQTGEEIHFFQRNGESIAPLPEVAFTAASLIKIPIMVSVYRRIDQSASGETINLLSNMIELSGNDPADWLMDQVIDSFDGPLQVTADMQALGLQNTFLAGFFAPGSPLLAVYETPANQSLDINTDPDPYNQTTLSDIGLLLLDIYQCAEVGGGTLLALFPEEITQAECQAMIRFLSGNLLPDLLTRGLPEGTQIAHKHGWITDFSGVINTIGDAGLIFTPGGNYVLVVFLHDDVQLVWEPTNRLVADLSQAVYNFYNLPP